MRREPKGFQLKNLKTLRFQFLSDEVIAEMHAMPEGLETAEFWGLRERVSRVDTPLMRILARLPRTLKVLALSILEESDSDWLYRGYISQPVSGLSLPFEHLSQLQSLKVWGCAVDNDFFCKCRESL